MDDELPTYQFRRSSPRHAVADSDTHYRKEAKYLNGKCAKRIVGVSFNWYTRLDIEANAIIFRESTV